MPKFHFIRVFIESPDNEPLDDFVVCWIKSEDAGSYSDEENVGDIKSHAQLIERICQYVGQGEPNANQGRTQ